MAEIQNNLSNFTDVFNENISDSPPISWPSQSSIPQTTNNGEEQPKKGTGQYKEFRSVEEIDPKYRSVFTYPYFNIVQSRVIEDALYSDKSVVVCAPTGSGKTVVFEMAIVKLLMDMSKQSHTKDFKIIYMAPIKAICTERLTEWYPKFTQLGLLCIEVTGDTDIDFSHLTPYSIIITTPEKWDMLTRRWTDYRGLVEMIKLFLIDEVHILNDKIRGPVLEAVVSRMKTIQMSAHFAHRAEQAKLKVQNKISDDTASSAQMRFVAVSATVSNPEDVATWLGTTEKPAVYHKFGDECRPVRIRRVVEGYSSAEGASIFKFDITLNYKLWPIIQKYHDGKPTLIFCNTRKSVLMTAETLSREITINFNPEQKANLTALASTIKNKKLQALILSGVGCHHAGLLFEERVNIEKSFRQRDLPILITTTTLAMGVNLPAHLVIIKNTQQYVNGQFQEYNISTVLQMVGRAGRPQFDTEATAVIMTRLQDKHRYQAIVCGSEPLESYLHQRLPENLNSEVALRTVCDLAQGAQWLRSTFLYVRAAREPRRYLGLPTNAPPQHISNKIEELCSKAMNGLVSAGLITMDETCCIQSTTVGQLMSLYYLDFQTMKHIMKVEGTESLERLLWVVCESHELSDMHLRVDERRCLNTLNRNNEAATIRYAMKGKISSRQMKLNCIIQAVLGCLPIPDPSLNQEAMKIMRAADRVCKCMVAYVTGADLVSNKPQFFTTVVNTIILAKCIKAHLWENSPYVSRQLKGIGPTFSTLLVAAGKNTFLLLEESHPRDLERIMNKGPPAGNVLRKQISLFPKYQISITPINGSTITVNLTLLNLAFLSDNIDNLTAGKNHKSYIIIGDSENHILFLKSFKDNDLINTYGGTITHTITRKYGFEHKIIAHCISSSHVGLDVQTESQIITDDSITKRFEDQPTPKSNANRKTIHKQTMLTDIYKPRKRKLSNENITVSKEKKSRETALIDKVRYLRDSIDVISKDVRNEFMSPATVSRDTEFQSNINKEIYEVTENIPDSMNLESYKDETDYVDLVAEDFDTIIELSDVEAEESGLCDDRINDILNYVESGMSEDIEPQPLIEIAKQPDVELNTNMNNMIENVGRDNSKYTKSTICTNSKPDYNLETIRQKCYPESNQKIYNVPYSIFQNDTTKYINKGRKRQCNNYAFINNIEREIHKDDDESPKQVNPQTGFCTATQLYLDKYLQQAKNNEISNQSGILKDLLHNDECKPANNKSETNFDKIGSVEKHINGTKENVTVTIFSNKLNKKDEEYKTYKLTETKALQNSPELTSPNKGIDHIFMNAIEYVESPTLMQKIPKQEIKLLSSINGKIECNKNNIIKPRAKYINDVDDPKVLHNNETVDKQKLKNKKPKVFINPFAIQGSMTKDENFRNNQESNNSESSKIANINTAHDKYREVINENTLAICKAAEENISTIKQNSMNDKNIIIKQEGNNAHKSKVIHIDENIIQDEDFKQEINNEITFDSNGVSIQNVNVNKQYLFKSSTLNYASNKGVKQFFDIQIKQSTTVTRRNTICENSFQHNKCPPINIGGPVKDNETAATINFLGNSKNTIPCEIEKVCEIQTIPEKDLCYENDNENKIVTIDDKQQKIVPFEAKPNMLNVESSDVNVESNVTVNDILNKYGQVLKKHPYKDAHSQKISNITNEANKPRVEKIKPKRLFKMGDINKVQAILPDSFITDTQPNTAPSIYEMDEVNLDNTSITDIPNNKIIETRNLLEEFKLSTDDDIQEIVEYSEQLKKTERVPDEAINQEMFNPMKLLQCFQGNDSELIISPPPQFSNEHETEMLQNDLTFDNDVLMNDESFSTSKYLANNHNSSKDRDKGYENNIESNMCRFPNCIDFESANRNPNEVVETWTLSQEDSPNSYTSNALDNMRHVYTVSRSNAPIRSYNKRIFPRNKLNQFKYNKEKFRR